MPPMPAAVAADDESGRVQFGGHSVHVPLVVFDAVVPLRLLEFREGQPDALTQFSGHTNMSNVPLPDASAPISGRSASLPVTEPLSPVMVKRVLGGSDIDVIKMMVIVLGALTDGVL